MGMYINPKIGTKEEYLKKYGTSTIPEYPTDKELSLVCLIDNGPFTAAGICFSFNEFQAFIQPSDFRRKEWYLVPTKQLVEDGFLT